MNLCDAVVVEISATEAWVELPARAPGCGSCRNPEICQDGLLGRAAGGRRYRLENSIGARVGDHVQIAIAAGTLWHAALVSYVLPLLLAIAAAFAGQSLGGDAWAVAGTLLGLGGGLLLLRHKELRARRDQRLFSLKFQTIGFKEQT